MYKLQKLQLISGLVHGFSEVSDGTMDFRFDTAEKVRANQKSFLGALSISPGDCVAMSVRHGSDCIAVGDHERGRGMTDIATALNVDAVMTNVHGLYLFLLTADCLPIILYDVKNGALALVHASRMNTPDNLSGAVVRKMHEAYGSVPDSLTIGIGPAIHKESYLFDGVPRDLIGENIAQLCAVGILEKNIEVSSNDTAADVRFFSHVRSGRMGEPEGRMATVAGML